MQRNQEWSNVVAHNQQDEWLEQGPNNQKMTTNDWYHSKETNSDNYQEQLEKEYIEMMSMYRAAQIKILEKK